MLTFNDRLKRLLHRRPYSVIGYSAEDEVWCPTCLRVAAGLSPGRVDYDGRPIQALYAADPMVHEEVCHNCDQALLDLMPALQPPEQRGALVAAEPEIPETRGPATPKAPILRRRVP
jgi:hypothetical protein